MVRIAFIRSAASWYLPEQLRTFRDAFPGIRFDLVQGAAREVNDRVFAGQSDLAITSPRPGNGLTWQRLYVERLCLAVPTDHRLASRTHIRLSSAANEPVIALGESLGFRQLTDQLWAQEAITPQIVFEASEISTLEGLVAAGLGVAVVPLPADPLKTKITYVSLSNSGAKRDVGLAWDQRRDLPPPSERFAAYLKRALLPRCLQVPVGVCGHHRESVTGDPAEQRALMRAAHEVLVLMDQSH